MPRSRYCSSCGPTSELGHLVPLPAVQPDLDAVDALSREIQDLTGLLKASLPPDVFNLVWSLRDAVESLGLCEAMLRERRLVDGLARHLPEHGDEIRSLSRHIFADDLPVV